MASGAMPWVVLVVVLLFAGRAQSAQPTEYQVKAAFLFNYAKFVEWPPHAYASDSAPIVIGIVGEDPFGPALPDLVQGETIRNRRIEVRRFQAGEDLSACHLMFISRSETGRTAEILERLNGRPVLTLSEQEDFLQQGGMINFVIVNERVRFDINAPALDQAGLVVSSKLLAVARTVVRKT